MNRALFLDRDGVINEERDYVYRKEDIVFLPGIFEISKKFYDAGYMVIVVTNQSGIGRGYFSEEDFEMLTDWIHAEFEKRGIVISDTFYCPFHPHQGIEKYRKTSFDRKPNPGMILKAAEKYDIDLKKSVLVGDREDDITAGKSAGVGTTVLQRVRQNPVVSKADITIGSLLELERRFSLP